jgi:DnaJ-class molecular chaperone
MLICLPRGAAFEQPVMIVAHGVAVTRCWECEGTGDWGRFLPEPSGEPEPCVECKGAGFRYVDAFGPVGSVW